MSKPTAIIAKLEDCPDWLDRTLAKAYWDADYRLESLNLEDEGMLLFRFDTPTPVLDRLLEQFDIQTFTIITAFNPGSIMLSLEENSMRHERLREHLLPMCRILRDSTGQSPQGGWQEHGFWALDLDLDQAVDLGRVFGQLAIVCWRRGRLAELWWL